MSIISQWNWKKINLPFLISLSEKNRVTITQGSSPRAPATRRTYTIASYNEPRTELFPMSWVQLSNDLSIFTYCIRIMSDSAWGFRGKKIYTVIWAANHHSLHLIFHALLLHTSKKKKRTLISPHHTPALAKNSHTFLPPTNQLKMI